jgi:hypothetical protein
MMEFTFLLEGPVAQGKTFGTVFIIGVPIPNLSPPLAKAVLVTAAHVLEAIHGDFATLHYAWAEFQVAGHARTIV